MTLYMKDEDRKPFPTWIDERAAETPERVFALIPRTNVVKDGYQRIHLSAACESSGQAILVSRPRIRLGMVFSLHL